MVGERAFVAGLKPEMFVVQALSPTFRQMLHFRKKKAEADLYRSLSLYQFGADCLDSL